MMCKAQISAWCSSLIPEPTMLTKVLHQSPLCSLQSYTRAYAGSCLRTYVYYAESSSGTMSVHRTWVCSRGLWYSCLCMYHPYVQNTVLHVCAWPMFVRATHHV